MGVAADGSAGGRLTAPLVQVPPTFERLSVREDRPLSREEREAAKCDGSERDGA